MNARLVWGIGALVALLALALSVASADAATIVLYDNFGSPPLTDNSEAWRTAEVFNDRAFAFSPTQTGVVESLDLAVVHFTPATLDSDARLILWTGPGNTPAVQLEDIVVDRRSITENYPLSVQASGTTLLTAGERYWISIGLIAPDSDDYLNWFVSNKVAGQVHDVAYAFGPAIEPDNPLNWRPVNATSIGAFTVNGSPVVPLPMAIWLYGAALGFLALVRRRGFCAR